MNAKDILKEVSKKEWTCTSRNCRQKATCIFVDLQVKGNIQALKFKGRCEKHRVKNCLSFDDLREIAQ